MPLFYDLEEELDKGNQLTRWKLLRSIAPVYVTNKTASGLIAKYDMALGFSMLVMFLALINAVGWGIYGVIELVGKVIS